MVISTGSLSSSHASSTHLVCLTTFVSSSSPPPTTSCLLQNTFLFQPHSPPSSARLRTQLVSAREFGGVGGQRGDGGPGSGGSGEGRAERVSSWSAGQVQRHQWSLGLQLPGPDCVLPAPGEMFCPGRRASICLSLPVDSNLLPACPTQPNW